MHPFLCKIGRFLKTKAVGRSVKRLAELNGGQNFESIEWVWWHWVQQENLI